MSTVEYPDWTPLAVREMTDELLAQEPMDDDDRAMQALALRLTTAPEMKAVWRRLAKWPLNAHWVRIRRAGCPELGVPRNANGPDSDRSAALKTFFKSACRGFRPPDSETLDRMAADAEHYRSLAAQLKLAAAS